MAPTPITPVRPTRTGVAAPSPTACDAVNGNSVPNSRNLVLTLTNSGAAPHTVTFQTPATLGGYAVADPQETIAAGASEDFGGFDTAIFGGTLTFTVDSSELQAAARIAG